MEEWLASGCAATTVRKARAFPNTEQDVFELVGTNTTGKLTLPPQQRGKGNCTACHLGPNFTDQRFHDTGVAWRDGRPHDPGMLAVTRRDADRGACKVPTKGEVTRTAPYMRDGSLEEVVDFYTHGGNPNPSLDPEIHPLNLRHHEKGALIEFLKAMTGTIQEEVPAGSAN